MAHVENLAAGPQLLLVSIIRSNKVKSATSSAKESCSYENLTVLRYDCNIESNIIRLQQKKSNINIFHFSPTGNHYKKELPPYVDPDVKTIYCTSRVGPEQRNLFVNQ